MIGRVRGRSVPVPAAGDRASGCPEDHQHQPDRDQDQTDGPQDRYREDESENQQDDTKDDHLWPTLPVKVALAAGRVITPDTSRFPGHPQLNRPHRPPGPNPCSRWEFAWIGASLTGRCDRVRLLEPEPSVSPAVQFDPGQCAGGSPVSTVREHLPGAPRTGLILT